MYGAEGDFLENIVQAYSKIDFQGDTLIQFKQKLSEMASNLEVEIEHWQQNPLHRTRDTSPEYRAYMYALFLQCRR